MKDRAGTELQIGDRVIFVLPHHMSVTLEWGEITGFTPEMVYIRWSPVGGIQKITRHPNYTVVKPYPKEQTNGDV